jgi:SOS-response transcriptional repressor LexA
MAAAPEPLAKIRNRLGLTQDEFAEKLCISRQHLSKLENSLQPLSRKMTRKLAEVSEQAGLPRLASSTIVRAIPIRSWAQAGTGADFGELPLAWEKRVATDCPDEQAFAVEIQGDSMETKFFPGDIAVLMPSYQPRNGSLVVARLEHEGVVFKVFTARDQLPMRSCCFTSYNPVFQPIEVPENSVIWNYPVYQIVRQIWR